MKNDEQNHETPGKSVAVMGTRQPSAKGGAAAFAGARRRRRGRGFARGPFAAADARGGVSGDGRGVSWRVAARGPRRRPARVRHFYATVMAGSPLESNALRRTFAMDRSSVTWSGTSFRAFRMTAPTRAGAPGGREDRQTRGRRGGECRRAIV